MFQSFPQVSQKIWSIQPEEDHLCWEPCLKGVNDIYYIIKKIYSNFRVIIFIFKETDCRLMSRTPTKKEKSLNKNHKVSHMLARNTLLRLPNQVLNTEGNTLFESTKNQNHVKKASFMSEQDVGKLSNKVMTSDESTSRKGSKLQ